MCGEVQKHLTLNYIPQNKKVSLKSQLNNVWEQTGQKPDKLEELEPDIPHAGKDLWSFFWEVKTGEELSWADIYSYCTFHGFILEPFEAGMLIAMNGTYNSYVKDVDIKKPREDMEKKNRKNRSKNGR